MRSLQLLEDLLSGQPISPADLDDLLANHPEENQHLDFKDGLETQKPKKASATVRQYVTAFANATGGTLILGVAEPRRIHGNRPARTVSPCTRPGGQPLDEWATRVLSDLAPYFSPPPRIQVVTHGTGDVLVIATARAPRLVPIVESGQLAYYVRLHESTVRAHDWLISDLVLGRRNHPMVEMSARIEGPDTETMTSAGGGTVRTGLLFWFILDIANASLVGADYVDAGVVTWACTKNAPVAHRELLSYVNPGESPASAANPWQPGSPLFDNNPPPWQLQHFATDRDQNRPRELRPFGQVRATTYGKASYPQMRAACEVTVAAYAMPKGSPPTWFELTFSYAPDGLVTRPTVTATPLAQAKVGWRFLG